MKNKTGQKQPGFEFNWKNKLAIWLVIVFIAIGQRSKISEKRYRDNVDEILLERNELEIPDLRRKKQG
jgi:hypothetical protein